MVLVVIPALKELPLLMLMMNLPVILMVTMLEILMVTMLEMQLEEIPEPTLQMKCLCSS